MKIKYRFLKFIEEKGIAKKVLNYLEKNGTVEISLVCLRWVMILFIISILINLNFLIKSGAIQQCVVSFFGFIWNYIIMGFLNFLKGLDKDFPGTLSFLGAVVGGILGFWGATTVFKKQLKLNRKQSIDKLMHLLLYTYRMISSFLNSKSNYKEFEEGLGKSELYKALVYDKNWRNYISEIDDYGDKENILRWFFRIEHQIVPTKEVTIQYLSNIENILNKYGYSYQLNLVKEEIESNRKYNAEAEYSK